MTIRDHAKKAAQHLGAAFKCMTEAHDLAAQRTAPGAKMTVDGEEVDARKARLLQSSQMHAKASFELSCAIDNINAITR